VGGVESGHCQMCGQPFDWCQKAEHYTCADCRKTTCCEDTIECGGNFGVCKRSICRDCWNTRTSRFQVCPTCNNYMGYSKSKHLLYHT
jgi:hypothetical protein